MSFRRLLSSIAFAGCSALAIASPASAQTDADSIARIRFDDLDAAGVASPQLLLRARVAGVEVIDDAAPGGGVSVRIRGGTSLGAHEPLYVVDGMPLTHGGGFSAGVNPLDFVTVSDVAAITVVKGAGAVAAWGARGGNGVVLITTRRGAAQPGFRYAGSLSTTSALGEPDFMDAGTFREVVSAYDAANGTAISAQLGDASTDWQEALQRTGVGHDHALSWSGGAADTDWRASVGYRAEPGVVRGSDSQRASAALSVERRVLADDLRLRASLRGAHFDESYSPIEALAAVAAMAPTQPIRDGADYFEWDEPLAPPNPVALLDRITSEGTTQRGFGVVEAAYRLGFVDSLDAMLRVGYDASTFERDRTAGSGDETEAPYRSGLTGSMTNTLLEASLAHGRRAGPFGLGFTLGFARETSKNRVDRDDSVSGLEWHIEEDGELSSLFARARIGVLDRYELSLGLRSDAIESGPGCCTDPNERHTYPSVAAAWRISAEPFMPASGRLGDLTLRASWGQSGTRAFGRYLVRSTADSGYLLDRFTQGSFYPGIFLQAEDLEPEKVTAYDVALDAAFGARLAGSVEYFRRTTDDLIYPTYTGGPLGVVASNVGSLENRGVELTLSAVVAERGAFSWVAGFTAAHIETEITELDMPRTLTGSIRGGVTNLIQIIEEGSAPYEFFVYRRRADNPEFGDIDGDGDVDETDLYDDLDGDGVINSGDRRAHGSPAPDWILGHTSRLRWGRLDGGFTVRAQLGGRVYNNVASFTGHHRALGWAGVPYGLHDSVLETGFESEQYFSDYYVEDASFVRMDELTVGYTLPAANGAARLYGTVHNVFTITEYRGVDPAAGVNGIDDVRYPLARTFAAGASVRF